MDTSQTRALQFGSLRALLHTPGWSFEALIDLLDQCQLPAALLDQEFIPYAAQRCSLDLEDDAREAPQHWIDAIVRGEEVTGWELARRASLSSLTQVLERPQVLSHITVMELILEDTASFNALITRDALPALRILSASFQLSRAIEPIFGVGDAPLTDQLWAHPQLSELEQLTLNGAPLGLDRALPHHQRAMPALTSLELTRAQLTDQSCARLAQLDMPKLRSLNLDSNAINAQGVEALMLTPWAAQLTALDLSSNEINERALRAILDHARVESLTLDSTKLSAQALMNTLDHPGWSAIKHLSLNWLYTLGDAPIEAIAANPRFTQLESLSLIWGGLSDRSAQAIATSPYLKRIKDLDLYRNQLGDEGAAALAQSEGFGELERLRVHENGLSDAGRELMRRSKGLARCVERSGAEGF